MCRCLFPRTNEFLIQKPWFFEQTIENYYLTINYGEKKYGRVIILKELCNSQVSMEFIRFINKPCRKSIGFKV